MASTLVTGASNLLAMASNLEGVTLAFAVCVSCLAAQSAVHEFSVSGFL